MTIAKPAFKGWGGGRSDGCDHRNPTISMGVTATPKEGAYWTHMESKEFAGSDQKFFDHHAFYFGYNVTNFFYIEETITKLDDNYSKLGALPS